MTTSHPSYGLIQISRAMGNRRLWGSPFGSGAFFSLTITTARLSESLGETHAYQGEHLIEIDLSPEQFLGLLTNMNMGDGTRCTLRHVVTGGTYTNVPSPPKEEWGVTVDDVTRESDATLKTLLSQLDEITEKVKVKSKSLGRELETVLNNVRPNLNFYFKRVKEAATKAKERAANEVVSTADMWLRNAGLSAIAEKFPGVLPKLDPQEQALEVLVTPTKEIE